MLSVATATRQVSGFLAFVSLSGLTAQHASAAGQCGPPDGGKSDDE